MKQYRVAVIGSTGRGDYGHDLHKAWLTIPNAQIIAMADDNREGGRAVAEELEVDHVYTDYRKMLDEQRPDIVTICQRWLGQHAEMAVAAAERGIHVYMEKPMCRDLEEADTMVAACEKHQVKLAVAHPTRYSPKLERLGKLLAAKRLGQVLEFRGRGKEDRRGGGEDLWVLGSHVMDMIRALAGDPLWCFARVTQGGQPVSRQHVQDGAEQIGPLAGDAVHAMYGMPDGSVAYFSSVANVAANPTRYGLQVFCSHGMAEVLEGVMPAVHVLRDRSWSPARSGKEWQSVSSRGWNKPEPLKGPEYDHRHTLALRDLLQAIEQDRQPRCSVYEGRGGIEMIAAVFESHRQGAPVPLPLENRKNPLSMLP